MTSNESAPEGFVKRGTTLEGRVAQLLRLMGYNVTRNQTIEGHEIDVYGEKDGNRLIVECKEYHKTLISRELIMIFSARVRDIKPDESWFVTIYDFDQSALELCKRYGIRAINGYDLEELEDEAIVKKGSIAPGAIPAEDRYLRLLERRRTELSREKRRYEEISRVAGQVNSLRQQRIELPAFLFPKTQSDLEEKYLWLNDLEEMPKMCQDATIERMIVNLGPQPRVKGFEVVKKSKYSLAAMIALMVLAANILVAYYFEPWFFDLRRRPDSWNLMVLPYFLPTIIIAISAVIFRKSLVYRRTTRSVRPATDSQLVNNVLYLAEAAHSIIADPFDVSSQRLYDLRLNLANGDELGVPINYVVEKGTWLIRGIQVRLVHEISKDTGAEDIIVPLANAEFQLSDIASRIQVNALYVLSDSFLKEKKMS
jgi:Holliday junction resolvase-like predicted endonuclease